MLTPENLRLLTKSLDLTTSLNTIWELMQIVRYLKHRKCNVSFLRNPRLFSRTRTCKSYSLLQSPKQQSNRLTRILLARQYLQSKLWKALYAFQKQSASLVLSKNSLLLKFKQKKQKKCNYKNLTALMIRTKLKNRSLMKNLKNYNKR